MKCIDDKMDPCYWRKPEMECGRKDGDGPCVHAESIAKWKKMENAAESAALKKELDEAKEKVKNLEEMVEAKAREVDSIKDANCKLNAQVNDLQYKR